MFGGRDEAGVGDGRAGEHAVTAEVAASRTRVSQWDAIDGYLLSSATTPSHPGGGSRR